MHSLTNSTNITDVPRNVTWLWMISWRKKLHTVLYVLELIYNIWRRRLLHFIVFQGLRFDSSWGLSVPRSRQDDKNISPYLHWTQNLPPLLFYLQKMTLSTLLILTVRRMRVIWTLQRALLAIESLWLSGRASGRGPEGLRFDFLWGLRILCPALVTRRI